MRQSAAIALLCVLASCQTGEARAGFAPQQAPQVAQPSAAAPAPAQAPAPSPAPGDRIVDRIVVRIEDDIITLSEMRELAGYQQLVGDPAEPDEQLISELIEQWVVNGEATAAEFPAPAKAEVDREVGRIESRFPSAQAYEQRLAELGITRETVRRIVTRQIFLARYLDYKFRPAVQVEDAEIEAYYKNELVPSLEAKKETAPPLADVREQIREVLVQRGINERANSWFDETKSRLNTEISLAPGPATVSHGHE